MRTSRALLAAAIGLLVSFPVFSASPSSPAEVLIQEAMKPSALGRNLEQLTDEIGGRVTGSPAMERAAGWGVDAFKSAGADSVHTETFTMPASWAEGTTQLSVVAPEAFPLHVVAMAWAPALAPQRHLRVVD